MFLRCSWKFGGGDTSCYVSVGFGCRWCSGAELMQGQMDRSRGPSTTDMEATSSELRWQDAVDGVNTCLALDWRKGAGCCSS
jgi:hypothetical protein